MAADADELTDNKGNNSQVDRELLGKREELSFFNLSKKTEYLSRSVQHTYSLVGL